MSDSTTRDRFEELEAGRILGDLSPEEWDDWRELEKTVGVESDSSLELVAAAIDSEFANDRNEEISPRLEEKLRAGIGEFAASTPPGAKVVAPDFRPSSSRQTILAWAVAAALAILLIAQSLNERPGGDDLDVATKLENLEKSETNLVRTPFAGLGSYEKMNGKVVWSDDRQEGYMILTNLPVNNPTEKQYQLWIVDPERDEAPVDGGVFDISADGSTAIVPIDAKLAVLKPQAFVITLEQPGGVVKSKQEVVVALAKAS